MAFCAKCGAQIPENAKFCATCGAAANGSTRTQAGATSARVHFDAALNQFNNTKDDTQSFHPEDIARNKGMAILAYLGFLVLIPLFAAKESPFARYHTNQGLILFILEVALSVVLNIVSRVLHAIWWGLGSIFSLLTGLIWLIFLIYVVFGIVNAARGQAKELPIIGHFTLMR